MFLHAFLCLLNTTVLFFSGRLQGVPFRKYLRFVVLRLAKSLVPFCAVCPGWRKMKLVLQTFGFGSLYLFSFRYRKLQDPKVCPILFYFIRDSDQYLTLFYIFSTRVLVNFRGVKILSHPSRLKYIIMCVRRYIYYSYI